MKMLTCIVPQFDYALDGTFLKMSYVGILEKANMIVWASRLNVVLMPHQRSLVACLRHLEYEDTVSKAPSHKSREYTRESISNRPSLFP